MRPTHKMEGNLLYSKSADSNVNLLQSILTETSNKVMYDQITPYCDLVKSKGKINCHSYDTWLYTLLLEPTKLNVLPYCSSLHTQTNLVLDLKRVLGRGSPQMSSNSGTPPECPTIQLHSGAIWRWHQIHWLWVQCYKILPSLQMPITSPASHLAFWQLAVDCRLQWPLPGVPLIC